MEQMLITLEETIAHQHREIQTLSDEMYKQQREIQQLRSEITTLQYKLKALTEHGDGLIRRPDEETPPPHY